MDKLKLSPNHNLLVKHPKVAKEWHRTKNPVFKEKDEIRKDLKAQRSEKITKSIKVGLCGEVPANKISEYETKLEDKNKIIEELQDQKEQSIQIDVNPQLGEQIIKNIVDDRLQNIVAEIKKIKDEIRTLRERF